jgi:predicted amidohydrolase
MRRLPSLSDASRIELSSILVYQNCTRLVAIAKAGVEDGHALIGGSVIVNPNGRIVGTGEPP